VISIENFIDTRYPDLQIRRPLFFKTLSLLLKQLFHESEFQQFERKYPHLSGVDFVEQVLSYFDFTYSVVNIEKERIPLAGRVVIVANHPIGSLDGLALLKLVTEVRRDVRVIANEVLASLKPLHKMLLPVDNLGGKTPRQNLKAIHQHLEQEGAVIIFPAGEVSRFGAKGVRDGKWNNSFIKLATSTNSPVLPVFIDGRNSTFFYALSFLSRPLSTLWLVREMFKQTNHSLSIRIGNAIRPQTYGRVGKNFQERADLFRRHVYRLPSQREAIFTDLVAIAHPENRKSLRSEIRQCQLLGETHDGKQIYLYSYTPDSCVIREIGRLRELSFRAVGEGTGQRRDTDHYDAYYQHIILWDDQELEIVGSYRIAESKSLLQTHGVQALYSSTLFDYQPAMHHVFDRGLELGRSFVQPRYWGKRSLDYLWFGIGAYLRANPHVRFLFGPVSISSEYNEQAKALLVHLYRHYFSSNIKLAMAKTPYNFGKSLVPEGLFCGNDYKADFATLKELLDQQGYSVPTLYKQYVDVCEHDGVQFAGFNVDPDFSNCIDGLVIVDLIRLKPKKRERYIG
jgi:putative hemolysin